MISVRNISKRYNKLPAISNISFDIQEGEHFILLGTSGCGKTTTLKIINRLIEPSAGAVYINNENIDRQPPEQMRRRIGYVLQRSSLFPHYTVYENIAVVPSLLKWDKRTIKIRIETLAGKLHLPLDRLHAYPHELSGGEAQRVNLARALAADPEMLLMDEPFGALDPLIRATIRKEFYELDEYRQKTILMVTHDVQEAFEMGDRICLMSKGAIMQTGTPAELLFRPANDFVRDFFSGAFVQLAFAVIPLRDIWSCIPGTASRERGTGIPVTDGITIGQAIQQIKDKNDGKAVLSVEQEGSRLFKEAGWPDLLSAFSKYQMER